MIAPQAIFCILIFLINMVFIFWVFRGLKKVVNPDTNQNPIDNSFSIIIAAHNEGNKIGLCLSRLSAQNYPKEKYEVILIADRCTDNTIKTAGQFQDEFNRLKIVEITEVPKGISPKKYALDKGIQKAKHNHLLFLDADVIVTQDHIRTMNQYFNEDVDVVVGIMKLELQGGFLYDFLKYERLLNWSVAAGSIGNGNPIISYGGNWGYTRQAFETVNGFEGIDHSLGGDDDLLLQKFGNAGLTARFCAKSDGWITTQAPKTLGAFLNQRKRHLSASKYYQNKFKAGYFLYHSSNLLLWISPLLFFPTILLLLLKIVASAVLIRLSKSIFQQKLSLIQTPLWEFVFLIYNIMVGPLGFLGKIKW